MKIAMLFPGYGDQSVGMGKELYDSSRVVQEHFEEASNCLNINFIKLCFASSDAELSKIEHALFANFIVSSSLYLVLKERGIVPEVVMGHDAGQYAAVFCAGGISFPDMLYFLQKYITFYQEFLATTPTKAIRVTGVNAKDLKAALQQYMDAGQVCIAFYEAKSEHVITGSLETIDFIKELLVQEEAKKIIELPLIDGLHCPLMSGVEQQMRLYSEKIDFKDLQIPLRSTVDVRLITEKDDVKQAILNSIIMPVKWLSCVNTLGDYDILVQVGPGTSLSKRLKKRYPDTPIFAINKDDDIKALQEKMTLAPVQEPQS